MEGVGSPDRIGAVPVCRLLRNQALPNRWFVEGRDARYRVHLTSSLPFPLLRAEDLLRLRRHAKQTGSTLNDLLLRDLFLSFRDWMQATDSQRQGSTLRIGIPQNLRQDADNAMPAANRMGMVFLDRDFRLPVNPKDLLDGIRRETAQIKRWSLGLGMVSVVNWSGRVRGGVAPGPA